MMPAPQQRVYDAVDRARVALGNVAPLTDMERAQLVDCLERIGVPASAASYRGWSIVFEYGWYVGTGPNFEASYEGEEYGMVGNGECVSERTIAALRMAIDAKLIEGAA